MNKIYFIILFVLFATNIPALSVAQQSTYKPARYNGTFFLNGEISLDSLTRHVHRQSGMRFSFNSSKVSGGTRITFPKKNYSFTALLERIKKTTSLFYTFYNGYVIFQDNPVKLKTATDSNSSIAEKKYSKPLKKGNGTSGNTKDKSTILNNSYKQKTAYSTGSEKLYNKPPAVINDNTKRKVNSLNIAGTPQTISDSIHSRSDNMLLVNRKYKIKKLQQRAFSILHPSGETSNKKAFDLHFGLQWNFSLPFQGTKNYFTGTNGKNQFYYGLIPGVWMSKMWGEKHETILHLTPAQQYFANNKPLVDSGELSIPGDSATYKKTTTLIKTSGFAVGLAYNYKINEGWAVGAGIHCNWQQKALLNQLTARSHSINTSVSDSLYTIPKSSDGWQYLKSSFFSVRVEISYELKNFRIGGAVLAPFPAIASSSLNKLQTINSQVFLRWRIK